MSVFAVQYVYDPASASIRDEYRPAHRSWLRSLEDEGCVLSAGAHADGAGALLIFRIDTEEQLVALLTEDPFAIEGGISNVEITRWKPAIGAFAEPN